MTRSRDALDPEIREFIADVCDTGARLRGGRALDWPQRRDIAEQARRRWREGGPAMAQVTELALNMPVPFRLRVYRPHGAAATAPALVYLHGGGWCLFSVDTHDRLLREYADAAGMVVVGIDYSLAPEHPYPVALDQAVAALEWLHEHGASHGIDAERVALGGDSAGANLAVATALRLRETPRFDRVKALLLNYGAWDITLSDYARQTLGTAEDMLSAAEMDAFWQAYLGDDAVNNADGLSAPLRADLRGLPPALLLWGDRDVLAEQSAQMAQRFEVAGVVVASQVYAGAPHSFIEAMTVSAAARDAIARGAAWLRRYLTPATAGVRP